MGEGRWSALEALGAERKNASLRQIFADDPQRFERFSARTDDLLLDYSKTAVTADVLAGLLGLAEARGVPGQRDAMFAGAAINRSENRAVLHTALRAGPEAVITVKGIDVMPLVRATQARLETFAEGVRSGSIAAADGGRFTDIVNIGIGGSDLGPVMVTLALAPYHDGPRAHFVSNVDGAHLTDVLKTLDPKRTLFIVASKTFTTIETMTNAQSARRWLVAALGEAAVGAHFAAVSTALDKVAAFGIAAERTFGFWDWVGGRYSVWSAVGLPVMIAIGAKRFQEFLAGARAMDTHFRTAPLEKNLPVLFGLIGVWHRNFCGFPARALLPYDQRLARLPAYVQQLDMESNGKHVAADGGPLPADLKTGPLVWGEPGTNGQHAFYQLLHQGRDVIPAEFLIAAEGHEPELAEHHALLVANCLAQSEALAKGRTVAEATAQLQKAGLPPEEVARLAPYKSFPGNRPSVTIAYRKLDPFTLGRLIALYEHRVFVEAAIWGINAFDQWGVELGKELATALLPAVKAEPDAVADPLTRGLLGALRKL
ncbi:glucose-6-phosphate isomerase [Elstera cyanobacteriorum]|uniref:Glucose-6-phosphate isomerase n=1 Tax=Elstera cyanobacteriorum TaxID=2022747 RepID=A0A255XKE3_9PROT|nr:glucose-6-phosphate isomerase [Elstera cyanobacteriorum]OYQ16750.1 glucose-6-phosphate isomerase [Elstera cyanobacteriorum]GFZ88333.1 glucose-6-phosphate isomerase [Elstera cyanobacteriorum]